MVQFMVARRLGACVLAFAAILLAASAGMAQDGRKPALHYLAVGVSRTPNLPANNQLRFAHKDALDCSAFWQKQQGGLYREVMGQTLVNEQATGDNVRAALTKLSQGAHAGDTVIVSLAGHGDVEGRGQDQYYFFLPYDFDPTRVDTTGVSAKELRDALAPLVRGGITVVLILDTCRAGAMAPQDSGIIVMAACLGNELSHEAMNNGLYTKALLEALQGNADLDRNGIITLAELEAYVSQRVPELLKQISPWGEPGTRRQNPTSGRPLTAPSNLPLANCLPSMTTTMPSQSGEFVTGPVR